VSLQIAISPTQRCLVRAHLSLPLRARKVLAKTTFEESLSFFIKIPLALWCDYKAFS